MSLPAEPSAKPAALMLQGTGSDVGKSLLAAGLCRLFTDAGVRVRPFKPQNMSNNAAVTSDGGEIGRAQALQARACRVPATSDMNPVLLKPETDTGAQVVVQGRVIAQASARDYHGLKPSLLAFVLESYRRLGTQADLMVVEGAGSPAEVNLRQADIANMGFAEAADVPVVLVVDIDRGGSIAAIVGTWELLPALERARLKGYIINKFRGDPALFAPAIEIIRQRTGLPCLGIVPWFKEASLLPAEDAASLKRTNGGSGQIHVAVPRLPRIANFDDFDPLAAEPEVRLTMVSPGEPLPRDADLVILPGSKSTIADLAFLKHEGWDTDLRTHLRAGGKIIGICAGYQMLGKEISDPLGVESPKGSRIDGLGLLDVVTEMESQKVLRQVTGVNRAGIPVSGYEIHMGRTTGPDTTHPLLTLAGKPDGAVSADGQVMGCYLHGLFTSDAWRAHLLAGLRHGFSSGLAYETLVEDVLDRLADHLAGHLDVGAIRAIAGLT